MYNNPSNLFIEYLVNFISQLRTKGYEVILVADISKNSTDRKLNKALH